MIYHAPYLFLNVLFLAYVSLFSMETVSPSALVPLYYPNEIWEHVLREGLASCHTLPDAKKYSGHFGLIAKQLYSVRHQFFNEFHVQDHKKLVNHFHRLLPHFSTYEIAYQLRLNHYISLNKSAMNLLEKNIHNLDHPAILTSLTYWMNKEADANWSWLNIGPVGGCHRNCHLIAPIKLCNAHKQSLLYQVRMQPLLVAYLLKQGANPDEAYNKKGLSVLQVLCQQMHPETCHAILYDKQETTRRINFRLKDLYAEYIADKNNHQLLDCFENNHITPKEDHVCFDNILTTITLLLEYGADAYKKDFKGLCSCAKNIYIQYKNNRAHILQPIIAPQQTIHQILQESNYNALLINQEQLAHTIHAIDYKRRTLLHSCLYGYFTKKRKKIFQLKEYEVLKESMLILLKNGIDINAQDGLGNTALHILLSYSLGLIPLKNTTWDYSQWPDVLGLNLIQLLIENNANATLRNHDYNKITPIELAHTYPSSFTKKILKIMGISQPLYNHIFEKNSDIISDKKVIELLYKKNN